MATLSSTALTLAEWGTRLDPGGKTADAIELLGQTNEMLTDMLWVEANDGTSHLTTVRTGLPASTWRLLNYGVAKSKSTTAQVRDATGMLESYSDIDKALADLNGNTAEFRLGEDMAFMESMNQTMQAQVVLSRLQCSSYKLRSDQACAERKGMLGFQPMNEEQLSTRALTAIRKSLPLDTWSKFADAIVSDRHRRQAHLAKAEPDKSWFGMLDQLRSNGFAKIPASLPLVKIAEVRAHFDAHPVHKGPHVYSFDGRPKRIDEARRNFSMAGYRFDQVMRAPNLIDTFNDPRLIDLIEAYLGCVPTLYSTNAWWSFPASRPELIHSQHFHRDIDDWRFVTLFLYLTDVDGVGGPHQVVAGSHTLNGMSRLVEKAKAEGRNVGDFDPAASFVSTAGEQFSKDCERLFGDAIFNATGPAGTMWLVNTMALHRGLMPTKSPRLIVWARYGLGPSVNSIDTEQGPVARRLVPTLLTDTLRNRFVNRLLFDFDRGPEY